MENRDIPTEVPTWLAGVIAVLVVLFAFLLLIRGEIAETVTLLVGAVQFGLGLFVVYLFYRFVIAVETIAEKI